MEFHDWKKLCCEDSPFLCLKVTVSINDNSLFTKSLFISLKYLILFSLLELKSNSKRKMCAKLFAIARLVSITKNSYPFTFKGKFQFNPPSGFSLSFRLTPKFSFFVSSWHSICMLSILSYDFCKVFNMLFVRCSKYLLDCRIE
jgi:hypothetical protein